MNKTREDRRLLLVSASLEGGGAERQLSGMANYWAAQGHQVTLVTWSGADVADAYPLDGRVQREYLSIRPQSGALRVLVDAFACVRGLRRLVRSLKPHVVLSFISSTNVLTILAAAGSGARVVVSERVDPAVDASITTTWRRLRAWTYRHADMVVAQTQDAAQWIRAELRARTRVIPNTLRVTSRVEPRSPVVLGVGRLVHQKGFDLLLRAFAAVAGEFPEWTLLILGEGPDRAALLALRDGLALTTRVSLPGRHADVEQWMARAGLVVQPSRYEGFPNVVLEAMGLGAAVISSDCRSGPGELIQDGVNGRLVPVEDLAALTRTMAELMREPAERTRLGAAAIKVREKYAEDRVMPLWNEALALETSSA